ncbi:MCE family protein [Nocardia panacis]|uniref:MCE family protein n=1 Tax=Nocardia panacis TaxID=2340916 RepID=A0A3A4KAP5_9NOCA|nr:MCE family protein [Nocardia panacis]RJO76950.1 MCE family protein [Nocardia panacis]
MIIDPSGRGPTMRQLLIAGVCGLLVFAVVLALLLARYRGAFQENVKVTANLTTTGDGLPEDADVKFRGVLVGAVREVSVAAKGEQQQVHIAMKPEFAGDIPATVTARVVPSNLFAVTSVELVFNGPSERFLHAGSVIEEDRSAGTIALQDTLTTVRGILDHIDPIQLGRVLGTLSQALDGSGRMPGSTIERLDNWLAGVRGAVPDLGGELDNFANSFRALNQSAPELFDVLGNSVQTARTIADRRDELMALLTGTGATVDKVNDLFARNPDVGKQVTTGTSDMFGALSADPNAITRALLSLNNSLGKLDTTFTWGPQQQMVWNAGISLTPFRPYTVADCPRYGDLPGPSCYTAPAEADPGQLPDKLKPRALDSAAGLPPVLPLPGLPSIPGITVPDSSGHFASGITGLAPIIPGFAGVPNPFAGTPLGGLIPMLPPGLLPPAQEPPPAVPAAGPIALRGQDAMWALLGHRPNAAEYLLLNTILKGGTMTVAEKGSGR